MRGNAKEITLNIIKQKILNKNFSERMNERESKEKVTIKRKQWVCTLFEWIFENDAMLMWLNKVGIEEEKKKMLTRKKGRRRWN